MAARTTSVTEVGIHFRALGSGFPLPSLSHRAATVKRGRWTARGRNWPLPPLPSAPLLHLQTPALAPPLPSPSPDSGFSPSSPGTQLPLGHPPVGISRGRHRPEASCPLGAQTLVQNRQQTRDLKQLRDGWSRPAVDRVGCRSPSCSSLSPPASHPPTREAHPALTRHKHLRSPPPSAQAQPELSGCVFSSDASICLLLATQGVSIYPAPVNNAHFSCLKCSSHFGLFPSTPSRLRH